MSGRFTDVLTFFSMICPINSAMQSKKIQLYSYAQLVVGIFGIELRVTMCSREKMKDWESAIVQSHKVMLQDNPTGALLKYLLPELSW